MSSFFVFVVLFVCFVSFLTSRHSEVPTHGGIHRCVTGRCGVPAVPSAAHQPFAEEGGGSCNGQNTMFITTTKICLGFVCFRSIQSPFCATQSSKCAQRFQIHQAAMMHALIKTVGTCRYCRLLESS